MKRSRYLAALKAKGAETRRRFFDAIADGHNIKTASAIAGVSKQRGSQFMAEAREETGL